MKPWKIVKGVNKRNLRKLFVFRIIFLKTTGACIILEGNNKYYIKVFPGFDYNNLVRDYAKMHGRNNVTFQVLFHKISLEFPYQAQRFNCPGFNGF